MKVYRFIRMSWESQRAMSDFLNSSLKDSERVISMWADTHEVLVLVEAAA